MEAIERLLKKGHRELALSVKRLLMGQSVQGLITMLDGMIEDYDEEAVGAKNSIEGS